MLRSLYAGVSGLRSFQVGLDVIGNNIANVNTPGYKSSRVTFKDMLSQTLQAATSSQDGRAGVNPMQVGLGVTIGSIDTDHTQGTRQTTGKTEDLSIEGNGFFVLRSGNSIVYTRAGVFDRDENGYLSVPGTGMKVQGWVNGQLQDIVLTNGIAYSAEPTSIIKFANNLNAYASEAEKTFTTTADVYDSLGGLHTVTLEFTKEETPSGSNTELNRWRWTMKDPQVFEPPAATTTVSFSGQNLDSDDATYSDTMTVFDSAGNPHTIDYTMTIDAVAHTATFTTNAPNQLYGAAGTPLAPTTFTFDAGTGAITSPTTSLNAWFGLPVTGSGVSFNFAGLTLTTAAPMVDPIINGAGNNIPVNQSGLLEFGSDGRLLMQNNNSVWFRPQVQKTVPWPTTVDVNTGFNVPYMGIDGTNRQISVQYSLISQGLYNWQATDSDGSLVSEGTYNAEEKTHVGKIVYSAYGAANKVNMTLDFSEVTSSDGDNSLAVSYRDGARNGSLKSYSIDFAGNIVGEFTNGMMRTIGQIALAKFANPAGLQKAGDTTFVESNNSGIAQLGKASTVGFGSITPGSLEMSNVDLSQEFTDMIVTQRGLQANSRIITTSDEVLQEIVNLKR